jgi:hypothetical protein
LSKVEKEKKCGHTTKKKKERIGIKVDETYRSDQATHNTRILLQNKRL